MADPEPDVAAKKGTLKWQSEGELKFEKTDASLSAGKNLKEMSAMARRHFDPPREKIFVPEEVRKANQADRPTFASEAFTKNPLVPLGMALTVYAIGSGVVSMVGGDRKRQQYFMRLRVGAQGFTVAMLAAGALYFAGSDVLMKDTGHSFMDAFRWKFFKVDPPVVPPPAAT